MEQIALCREPNSRTVYEIRIQSRVVIIVVVLSISFLTLLGFASAYALYILEMAHARLIAQAFLLDAEANLPTLFSFGLLLFCSLMLLLISIEQSGSGPKWQLHWRLLTVLFFVMAFDEAAMVHEKLILPIRDAMNSNGLLFFAWVVPAWILVIIVAFAYLRFLLTLPKSFRRLFTLSGALYVGGALGLEMLGGAYAEIHGMKTFAFQMFATAEEILEMAGLALFAYSLMRFLAHRQEPLCLRVRAC